ncbi:hypothetical protein MASR2M66_00730 [Chloroflexota bacterium]
MFPPNIPILVYHQITSETPPANLLFAVSADQFKSQMRYLYENKFICLSLSDILNASTEEYRHMRKTFALTFDDGYESFRTYAWPVLRDYGFTATVFLIANRTYMQNDPRRESDKRYLTCEQIEFLYKNNTLFGSHTCSHPKLPDLPREEIQRELADSKISLESKLSRKVEWIAYPYGASNDDIQKMAEAVGYKAAFGLRGKPSRYNIRRQTCLKDDSLLAFAIKLNRVYRYFERLRDETEIGQFFRKVKHRFSLQEGSK